MEAQYYCTVCGVLREEHGIFDDLNKLTDEEWDTRWKQGLSVPFHPGMKLTMTFSSGLPPIGTIRIRNGKPKTQN